eukprot:TRINITY_DN1850_c0_g1_i2.p1 TRINITY_DN1850_c0_g1~~TRINITY_DN1850_c0_g1_i2.p1  ORF type:complete len:186 (+),score=20.41 TRINITY_DN1850_c0_g1_i2:145-702(+)
MGSSTSSIRGRIRSTKISAKTRQGLVLFEESWADLKGKTVNEIDWKTTTIDRTEFIQLMTDSSETCEEYKILFDIYDTNHDGRITWNEFICALSILAEGSALNRLQLVFNCFDQDGNEILTRDEFIEAGTKITLDESSVECLGSAFDSCDTNHDGKITYTEFCAWYQNNPEAFKKYLGTMQVLLS